MGKGQLQNSFTCTRLFNPVVLRQAKLYGVLAVLSAIGLSLHIQGQSLCHSHFAPISVGGQFNKKKKKKKKKNILCIRIEFFPFRLLVAKKKPP